MYLFKWFYFGAKIHNISHIYGISLYKINKDLKLKEFLGVLEYVYQHRPINGLC